MSKKQDFIRSEQNRDKHPELKKPPQARATPQVDAQDPGAGKLANDHNKQGAQAVTQTHEARRTPESRHEHDTRVGTHNVIEARTGGKGAGRGNKRGAG